MKNGEKIFRSRISVLFLGFIFAVFIPSTMLIIKQHMIIIHGLLIMSGASLSFFLFFGGMRYVISGEKLFFKMWSIPGTCVIISDIVSIERSYNPLSSPAASFKRLSIRFKKGSPNIWWLISPVREKEFIDMLKAVNPDIEVHIPEKKGVWRIWDWDI